jgi:predicted transcriptional regulator of viral defense system
MIFYGKILHHGGSIMTQNITGLSPREAAFLTRLAGENRSIFRYEEVADTWPDSVSAHHALSRLQRGGWLKRIERGLYMVVPLSAGPDRVWTENALLIGTRLIEPSAIAYWSALRFWNFTEQVPHTVFIQSPRRKLPSKMVSDGVQYQVITIGAPRFFGLARRAVDGQVIQVTDRAKSVLDAADRPDLCGGIWQLAQALRGHWAEVEWLDLDDYLLRFASGAVYKRLGYLVETLDLQIPERAARLVAWQAHLTAGIALLDPGEPLGGSVYTRWRVRDNIGLASVGGGQHL